jgi:hypothetical protein
VRAASADNLSAEPPMSAIGLRSGPASSASLDKLARGGTAWIARCVKQGDAHASADRVDSREMSHPRSSPMPGEALKVVIERLAMRLCLLKLSAAARS